MDAATISIKHEERLSSPISDHKPVILCKVCGDRSSGKHYGVFTCDGCRGFFKRSIRRSLSYQCKENGNCHVDVTRRNQCQACRLKKCFDVKMNRDAVQHERAPRSAQVLPPRFPRKNLTSSSSCYEQQYLDLQHAQEHTGEATQEGFRQMKAEHDSPKPSNQPTCSPPSTPPQYHGQNNNQSPDSTKKHGFLSITAFLDTKADAKEKEIPSPLLPSQSQRERVLSVGSPTYAICGRLGIYSSGHGPNSLYESAVQLLYMSVTWARNIPTFLELPFRDQAILLEEGWSELFVLSAAQFNLPLDMGPLLNEAGLQVDRAPTDRIVAGMADIRLLQSIVARFKAIEIDPTEYACLKAVVLFKPDLRGLRAPEMVERLQDQAQTMLGEYCRSHSPSQHVRFGKLLLLLPTLRAISPKMVEDLFFRGALDSIPIERMLCDMFKSS